MAAIENKASDAVAETPKHSVLDSKFPVFLPHDPALFLPEAEFQDFVTKKLTSKPDLSPLKDALPYDNKESDPGAMDTDVPKSAFMEGLSKNKAYHRTVDDLAADNKTLTENADVTNISSKNPLVDLFYDIEETIEGDKLKTLLEKAWKEDRLATLKIIFNARSIHLGKSNRISAYKAFGWLAENHPLTLLTNLRWLVRPVIEKKVPKPEEKAKGAESGEKAKKGDDDFDIIEAEDEKFDVVEDPSKVHDVRFGVSHGYWKDLLNLVALAANDELKFNGDPASVLTQHPENSGIGKRKREWQPDKAKELRRQQRMERHERVLKKLEKDSFYHALHLTVARLFAAQLKEDAALLGSEKKSDLKKLSLAAKWAPTFGEFHDKHTFILSSIAEIVFPKPEEICPDASNRELYLRHARENYRYRIGSPLRKALAIVERDIAANTYDNIKYERVPSLAMDRYTKLFVKKDYEHFSQYITKVAEGSVKISGATLLPSTLVSKARTISEAASLRLNGPTTVTNLKAQAEANITRNVIDGQWSTLVQCIRNSGVLESSIAVCDVSGSMSCPEFKDGTVPMDSSIGLSLLLAEITKPPFGGSFITFSNSPAVLTVGGENDPRGLVDKVDYMLKSDWGYNTDFVKVFEDLILPMAIHHNLKQEDMVKQVFVFSDMQFDEANDGAERWSSSFERIKGKYEAADYEMPKLIFWNLAGDSTSKPVTNDNVNTALVSGYSQGMLKVFLDGGGFEAEEEEEVVEEEVVGEDGAVEVKVVKKDKMDPLTIVKKAVSHNAYSMLEVVD
ncbi:hypothetical protein K469DRAFT_620476 [Zopfia rhizophila CBS 207.26]|uniref:Uncharacterized protein n=1 Tax=Zopfia rhizophila CBS 207.26 TaxID=1314779 RepID=A0A6A6EM12_9PEZI|nr:hypothetical protein K469DRAFT_620476 [Zopfia rhizophila CBS 207.26]